MTPLDVHYLTIQFRNKINSIYGTEFQHFFEAIMVKSFPDFQIIKPHGRKGDGGNDGFRRDLGIYYQVYSPQEPMVNKSNAAKKYKADFTKLKNGWDQISTITKYYFVFNDKFEGSIAELEKVMQELKAEEPNVEFKLLLTEELQSIFLRLKESDFLALGFSTSRREAIENASIILKKVEIMLRQEDPRSALKFLSTLHEPFDALNEVPLFILFEILEIRCLSKLEEIDEAKKRYESIIQRYPDDPRAYVLLAEICMREGDERKNLELLEKAKEIDEEYGFTKLGFLNRCVSLNEQPIHSSVDEDNFPSDSNLKSDFYRVYSIIFLNENNLSQAEKFVRKAINCDPQILINHIARLQILEGSLFHINDSLEKLDSARDLLKEVLKVEASIAMVDGISVRIKIFLNIIKLNSLIIIEDYDEIAKVSLEILALAIHCYFDKQIERIVANTLLHVAVERGNWAMLLEKIIQSKLQISDKLARSLLLQFNVMGNLFSEGKHFFSEIEHDSIIALITNIENTEHEKVLAILRKDVELALIVVSSLRGYTELRNKILAELPQESTKNKEFLQLMIYIDENNLDDAYRIIKHLDFKKLSSLHLSQMINVVHENKAWDYEIIILNRLLESEKDDRHKFNLKLRLMNAHGNLEQFLQVIKLGEELLEDDAINNFLIEQNREKLLGSTIYATLKRGLVEDNLYVKAEEVLEKYRPSKTSFEFSVSIEAEVYIKVGKMEKVLAAVIKGYKTKRLLSTHDYMWLFNLLIRLENRFGFKLDPIATVVESTFVKLKEKDQWYYIGDEDELDAIKISVDNKFYQEFLKRNLGDKILLTTHYSSEISEHSIELIFPIEKYVFWQVKDNFNKLLDSGTLDSVTKIETPIVDDDINLTYVKQFFEDIDKDKRLFFLEYIKHTLPLAFLAKSEGNLNWAIGKINNEKMGFVNFSSGQMVEIEHQKTIVRKIIQQKSEFFIDGTSAYFLAVSGILSQIYKHIPCIKVPQSVISFLVHLLGEYSDEPGRKGFLNYVDGEVRYSSINKLQMEETRNDIRDAIKTLEQNQGNIVGISNTNRAQNFTVSIVAAELSDACLLSQKYLIPVLTEDFQYLLFNEKETGEKTPEFFSSYALLRVLYEDGVVSSDIYFNYFYLLTNYRFRFLPLVYTDIEEVIFGKNPIAIVNPKNLKKLNLSFILAEEYGVPLESSLKVVALALQRMLLDNSIVVEIMQQIFREIIESFPAHLSKDILGDLLLNLSCTLIDNQRSPYGIEFVRGEYTKKVVALKEIVNDYKDDVKIFSSTSGFGNLFR